ncbi:hypothetical protein AAFF_G00169820 [Aldrovandia affinis]|uniref:Uncharacterized protein n=1 Tax=Aldrovandia affinis TaxID=143900 RepID=A0AAD7RM66_9TELE|nr:hypothetical protein AAFF_G00169820 [Aldrovandia affinis]
MWGSLFSAPGVWLCLKALHRRTKESCLPPGSGSELQEREESVPTPLHTPNPDLLCSRRGGRQRSSPHAAEHRRDLPSPSPLLQIRGSARPPKYSPHLGAVSYSGGSLLLPPWCLSSRLLTMWPEWGGWWSGW